MRKSALYLGLPPSKLLFKFLKPFWGHLDERLQARGRSRGKIFGRAIFRVMEMRNESRRERNVRCDGWISKDIRRKKSVPQSACYYVDSIREGGDLFGFALIQLQDTIHQSMVYSRA
jgi:hypothetical protein